MTEKVLLLLAIMASFVYSIVYVDKTSSSSSTTGSLTNPFSTLQSAILSTQVAGQDGIIIILNPSFTESILNPLTINYPLNITCNLSTGVIQIYLSAPITISANVKVSFSQITFQLMAINSLSLLTVNTGGSLTVLNSFFLKSSNSTYFGITNFLNSNANSTILFNNVTIAGFNDYQITSVFLINNSTLNIQNSNISSLTITNGVLFNLINATFYLTNTVLTQLTFGLTYSAQNMALIVVNQSTQITGCTFANITLYKYPLIIVLNNVNPISQVTLSASNFNNITSPASTFPLILTSPFATVNINVLFCNFVNISQGTSSLFYATQPMTNLTVNGTTIYSSYGVDLFYIDTIFGVYFNSLSFNSTNIRGNATNTVSGGCLRILNTIEKVLNNLQITYMTNTNVTAGLLIIDNSTLSSRIASMGYSKPLTITISNGNFGFLYNYYTQRTDMSAVFFFNTPALIYIMNSTFFNNSLDSATTTTIQSGGTCISSVNPSATLQIFNSKFFGNLARLNGGSIMFYGMLIMIVNTSFINNNYYNVNTNLNGGALYLIVVTAQITGSTFVNNSAIQGGAIYFIGAGSYTSPQITITNSLFNANSAAAYGGSVYFETGLVGIRATVNNITCINGIAMTSGGCFASFASRTSITFDSCYSSGCFVGNGGGFLYFYDKNSYILVKNIYVGSNMCYTANQPSLGNGGAYFLVFANFIGINNYYENNLVGSTSGIGYLNDGNFTEYYASGRNLTAYASGGGFVTYYGPLATYNGKWDALVVEGLCNYAASLNGSMFIANSTFTNMYIKQSLIGGARQAIVLVGNSFYNLSGVESIIGGNYDATFTLNDTLISNCLSAMSMIGWQYVNVTVNNLTVINSIGRLIFMKLVNLNVTNIKIINHTCVSSIVFRGCIIYTLLSNVSFVYLSISNLSSNDQGGVIYSQQSVFIINNTQMTNVYSSAVGSLYYGFRNSTLIVDSTSITNYFQNCISLTNSNVTIKNSQFMNNATFNVTSVGYYLKSTIICQDCYTLYINNSLFYNPAMLADYGSAIHIASTITNYNEIFLINSSNFTQNSANRYAGAINIEKVLTIISYCSFSSNSAPYGGAIYYNDNFESDLTLTIANNTFFNNTAINEGASLKYIEKIPLVDTSNTYINNTAVYGPGVGAYPVKLRLQIFNTSFNNSLVYDSLNTSSFIPIITIPTSQTNINISISFSIVDHEHQVVNDINLGSGVINNYHYVTDDQVAALQANISNLPSIFTTNKSNIVLGMDTLAFNINGSFRYNYVNIQANQNSTILFYVSNTHVSSYLLDSMGISPGPNDVNFLNMYQFIFLIKVRSCQIGEVYSPESNACASCLQGYYSFNPANDTACSQCPGNAQCFNGSALVVDPEYWRSSPTSSNIYYCYMNPAVCHGGLDTSINQCKIGHIGPLCAACDVYAQYNNDSYVLTGGFTCTACGGTTIVYVKFVGFLLLGIFFFIYLVYGAVSKPIKKFEEFNKNSIYKKIFLNYFQLLAIVTALEVKLPDTLRSFFGAQSSVGFFSNQLISVDCFLTSPDLPLKPVFVKIIVFAILPFVVLGVNFIFWRIHLRNDRNTFEHKLMVSTIVIVVIFQPPLMQFFFDCINCVNVDGVLYMKADMNEVCSVGNYNLFLFLAVIPSLCIWVLVCPLAFIYYLSKNINKIKEYEVFSNVTYLISGYSDKYTYWEVMIFIRKACLIVIVSFVNIDIFSKGVILFGFVLINLYHHVLKKPFIDPSLNQLEIISLTIVLLTVYLCLFFIGVNDSNIQVLLYVLIIVVNCLFMAYFIYLFIIHNKDDIRRTIAKVRTTVARKASSFIKMQSISEDAKKSEISIVPEIADNKNKNESMSLNDSHVAEADFTRILKGSSFKNTEFVTPELGHRSMEKSMDSVAEADFSKILKSNVTNIKNNDDGEGDKSISKDQEMSKDQIVANIQEKEALVNIDKYQVKVEDLNGLNP